MQARTDLKRNKKQLRERYKYHLHNQGTVTVVARVESRRVRTLRKHSSHVRFHRKTMSRCRLPPCITVETQADTCTSCGHNSLEKGPR